jgi:hypothetical protein
MKRVESAVLLVVQINTYWRQYIHFHCATQCRVVSAVLWRSYALDASSPQHPDQLGSPASHQRGIMAGVWCRALRVIHSLIHLCMVSKYGDNFTSMCYIGLYWSTELWDKTLCETFNVLTLMICVLLCNEIKKAQILCSFTKNKEQRKLLKLCVIIGQGGLVQWTVTVRDEPRSS